LKTVETHGDKERERERERERRQKFSKVSSLPNVLKKLTKELTFEKFYKVGTALPASLRSALDVPASAGRGGG